MGLKQKEGPYWVPVVVGDENGYKNPPLLHEHKPAIRKCIS